MVQRHLQLLLCWKTERWPPYWYQKKGREGPLLSWEATSWGFWMGRGISLAPSEKSEYGADILEKGKVCNGFLLVALLISSPHTCRLLFWIPRWVLSLGKHCKTQDWGCNTGDLETQKLTEGTFGAHHLVLFQGSTSASEYLSSNIFQQLNFSTSITSTQSWRTEERGTCDQGWDNHVVRASYEKLKLLNAISADYLTSKSLHDLYMTNGGNIMTICVFLHKNFVLIITTWS